MFVRRRSIVRATALLAGLALALTPIVMRAQDGYRQPPTAVAQILDAPALPTVMVTPDRKHLMLLERPGLPSIAGLALTSLIQSA